MLQDNRQTLVVFLQKKQMNYHQRNESNIFPQLLWKNFFNIYYNLLCDIININEINGTISKGIYQIKLEYVKSKINKIKEDDDKIENKRYGTYIGEPTDISDPSLFDIIGHFSTCNTDLMEFQAYREEQIKQYQNIIQYYQNKKELTNEERLAIKMSQKYHDLLLQELKTTSEKFEPIKTYSDAKVLKLTKPNYNIRNTIHYVE